VTELKAIFLGFLQGATEFLPVSSSGHLVMGQELLGLSVPGITFEIVVHVATLLSVLVVYRERLLDLARKTLVKREGEAWRYVGLLTLATLPVAVVGLTQRARVEALFETPVTVGVALLFTGTILLSTRWALKRELGDRFGWRAALLIGVAQCLALVPGVSRSGDHGHRGPLARGVPHRGGGLLLSPLHSRHRRGGGPARSGADGRDGRSRSSPPRPRVRHCGDHRNPGDPDLRGHAPESVVSRLLGLLLVRRTRLSGLAGHGLTGPAGAPLGSRSPATRPNQHPGGRDATRPLLHLRTAAAEPSGPDLSATLIVSYMGFDRREVPLEGRADVRVELSRAPIDLDALVVVGYGTQRRRDLTGSVASIGQADIAELPVYSLENVLQGMAARVDVSANGFSPGESSTIRIRGTRSLSADNDPLFVIDGVPVEGGIMDLNPGDIESIEVLKDASSTAIYGSRGANGVILVTTRRGMEGATQIHLSSSMGTHRITRMVEMMDAERYAEMKRQAELHQGTYTTDEALFEPFERRALESGTSIDWQELAYRPGAQQDHQLSVSGGTADTRVSMLGSYSWHDAIAPNNDFARYSARVNLDHQATDALQLGVSAHLSRSVTHRGGSISRVMRVNPMAPPHDDEGTLVFLPAGDPFQENPLFDFDRSNYLDERRRSRVLANLFGQLQLTDGLRYRLNFAPDLTFVRNGRFRGSQTIANALGPADARVQHRQTSSYLVEHIADWDWFRGDDHHLNVTGLYSFQVYNDEATSSFSESRTSRSGGIRLSPSFGTGSGATSRTRPARGITSSCGWPRRISSRPKPS
jgi:TonB-dependent SusC/RagA subfamily outer membrane receptor